jgi:hypothetical protein
MIWKEVVMPNLKVALLSWHSPGGAEKTHDKHQSG